MADTHTAPARFFDMPVKQKDGSVKWEQSHVQIGPGGRPVAVSTPQQFLEWQAIQDAMPLSASAHDAQQAAYLARPLFGEQAEADEATGGNLLVDARFAAEAQAGVTVVTEASKPATQAEHDQRTAAAVQLAAALGLALVMVRDDPVMKVPSHLELRQNGMPYMAGDLVTLETALRNLARERARNDAQIRLWQENRARIERERAEAIAALPENRLARLEAKLAEAGIEI